MTSRCGCVVNLVIMGLVVLVVLVVLLVLLVHTVLLVLVIVLTATVEVDRGKRWCWISFQSRIDCYCTFPYLSVPVSTSKY